jgi:hypothetical protein
MEREMDLFSPEAQDRFARAKEQNDHCYIDRKHNCIMIKTGVGGGSYEYDITLKRCKTAAQCLDWIHQVNGKTWATPELMKDFITILFLNIEISLWAGA